MVHVQGTPDEVHQHEAQSIVKHLEVLHNNVKHSKEENAQLKSKLEVNILYGVFVSPGTNIPMSRLVDD
jgi:hypothetical protein